MFDIQRGNKAGSRDDRVRRITETLFDQRLVVPSSIAFYRDRAVRTWLDSISI